jgi:D-alanyl-lipoteichoic acid acyltransferase DltB (MBOAT superfamily)
MYWNVKYVFLILFTTATSYICAILIEKTPDRKKKKLVMLLGVALGLVVLFFFKYFNFFSVSAVNLLNLFAPVNKVTINVLLPVGISFYTFQTLSYVIDVYKREIAAEKHFGKYAVFVSFFPQLVAGPIERSRNLLPEVKKRHVFNYENAVLGMKLMTWGFFKKLVIADNMAPFVDTVYNNVSVYSGFVLIVATIFFAFQIYCDFSGYSDIAIGVAKLFDVKLMINFKNPYFSASLREFWSRWHISLSTWFRDYVYIPLGGNRVSPARKKINLMVTFLASGLWHGANWTFVLWGALHGMFQILEGSKKDGKTGRSFGWLLRVIMIFLFVCFAWIFFRSNNIADAIYIVTHLFSGMERPAWYFGSIIFIPQKINQIKGVGGIVVLLLFDFLSLKMDVWEKIKNFNVFVRYSIYFGFVIVIIFFMNRGSHEFVYFQF